MEFSVRNNEQRTNNDSLNISQNDESSPTMEQHFSFVSPKQFVELPSKGKFYPSNHPFFNKDDLEIHYMSAKEEESVNLAPITGDVSGVVPYIIAVPDDL